MGNEWLEVARGRVWAWRSKESATKTTPDAFTTSEKRNPSSLAPSLPAGDRRNQMRGKERRFEREGTRPKRFRRRFPSWQNWQPGSKGNQPEPVFLGLKCADNPTQHQFCTEISPRNGLRTYWNSRFSHEKNKPGNLPSCYSPWKPDQQEHPTCPSRDSPSSFAGIFGATRKYRSSYEFSPRSGLQLRGLFRCNHVRFIPFPAFAPCFSGSVGRVIGGSFTRNRARGD